MGIGDLTRVRRAVLCALVISAAAYWAVRGAEAYGRYSVRVSFVGASNLVLLNGASVDLNDPEAFRSVSGDDLGSAQRRLVIVESDSCPSVQEIVPKWVDAIRQLPADGTVAVVIVNLGGQVVADQLVATAKQAAIPHQLLAVAQSVKASYRAGFVSAPWTLVVDPENRVRRTAMGLDYIISSDVRADLQRCLINGACN